MKLQEKKKILCFHGIATNAEIMNFQLRQFIKEFQNFEFITFNGPIIISKKVYMDQRLSKLVEEDQDVYSWANLIQRPIADDECEGIGPGIQKAINLLQTQGPFHGILGFSQGSNIVAKLCNLIEIGKVSVNYQIKFFIFVSSAPYMNQSRDNIQLYKTPSLHFIGINDFLVDKSLVMSSQFTNPFIIFHNQGHKIPNLTYEQIKQVRQFLEQKQDNMEWSKYVQIPKL